MKTRKKTEYGNEELVQDSLDVLANKETGVDEYRDAFEKLGKKLGEILAKKFEDIPAEEMDKAMELHKALVEAAAENDEH